MFYWKGQTAIERQYVRDLPLLEGEEVEEKFVPDHGLVSRTPDKGQLLVLTNQRVISFVHSDGHKRMFLAPLEEFKGVSVKADDRGFKDIFSGLALMVVGILAYFIIGYIFEDVTLALPALVGIALILFGVMVMARYFFWEEEGSITFQGGSWELPFNYRTDRSQVDVYKLVDRFFQLKLHSNTHHPQLQEAPEAALPDQPSSPPPTYLAYDI